MIQSKPTSGNFAFLRRLKAAVYTVAGSLFAVWIISGIASSTVLVSDVPLHWKWPIGVICTSVGTALGYTLPVKVRHSSQTVAKAAVILSTSVFAIFYCVIGNDLSERLANFSAFWGRTAEAHTSIRPVKIVGMGRGARYYVELTGLRSVRFNISKLDFRTFVTSSHETASEHYCLPVIIERVGQIYRVRLPDAPRSSVTARTMTIVKCTSSARALILIS